MPFASGLQLLKTILDLLDKLGISRRLTETVYGILFNRNIENYCEGIQERYGVTLLIGNRNSIPLAKIFTDIYVYDAPIAQKSAPSVEQDENVSRRTIRRYDGIEYIKSGKGYNRLLILGKPGVGKTTFLKHIAVEAAKAKIEKVNDFKGKIPIFIALKLLADEKDLDLLSYIVEKEFKDFSKAKSVVEGLLKKGDAIILFDGLDEVLTERTRVIKEVLDFCRRYQNTQSIITCRTAELQHHLESFTEIEIAEFNKKQIEVYAKYWFSYSGKKELFELFIRQLNDEKNRTLYEMATVPVLLSLLCLCFKNEKTFPEQREEIYEKALDILLFPEDLNALKNFPVERSEVYEGLTLDNRKKLFSEIAYHYSLKGETLFKKKELINLVSAYLKKILGKAEIDGKKVLDAMESQHGILIEGFHQIYIFSHRSIQEFFAAQYLVKNKCISDLLKSSGSLEGWVETILFAANLEKNSEEFFRDFQKAIEQMINSDKGDLQSLLQWANEKSKLVSSERAPIIVRFFYCYLGIIRMLKDTLTIEFDRAVDRAFHIESSFQTLEALDTALLNALQFAGTVDEKINQALSPIRDLAGDRNLNPSEKMIKLLDLETNLGLELDLDFKLAVYGIMHDIYYFGRSLLVNKDVLDYKLAVCWNQIQEMSVKIDAGLAGSLSEVPLLDSGQKSEIIFLSKKDLSRIMRNFRNLKLDWNFSPNQLRQMGLYLQASKLLLDSLSRTSLNNKDLIEERLLLPLS